MKVTIGYHASHEQFSPRDLLSYVVKAEQAGFQGVLCSDHFYPWSDEQGQSGFAWSWLGAALQATERISFGVVNAPGQRYHPAIIAQACATLEEMFPQRFWIAVGSGQYLNEHITGTGWPAKADRNIRLKEAAQTMLDLWDAKTVNKDNLIKVENARLYTRPAQRPELIGAALSTETAKWVGGFADGMITASDEIEHLKEMISVFRSAAGEHKPVYLKVQLSYARDAAVAKAEGLAQWRNNIIDHTLLSDLRTPQDFDQAGKNNTMKMMEEKLLMSSSPDEYVDYLNELIALGFTKLYLHNVNRHQEEFIEDFGKYVLPRLGQ